MENFIESGGYVVSNFPGVSEQKFSGSLYFPTGKKYQLVLRYLSQDVTETYKVYTNLGGEQFSELQLYETYFNSRNIMEFLKRKAILFILILAVFPVFGQVNQETLEQAFVRSYELEKNKDFVAAAGELNKVYDQASYEINLRMGWLYYNAGRFDESVTYYSRAQQLKPYSEEARFGLILPKAALGQWDEVIELYNKILEIHPNNTVAMFRWD
jgi:tetratricopeptide (TPR) repeat protein